MFIDEIRLTVGIRAKRFREPEIEKKDNDSGNRFREENQKVQGTRDREVVLTIQGIVPEKI